MKLKITVGGKSVTATLADNATAQDFVSVLPLELTMKDLFGREKYAPVPKRLAETGPKQHRYEVGDIAYWPPSHDVAIYYKQDEERIPPPGIIPLAKLDEPAQPFHVKGPVKVRIEAA